MATLWIREYATVGAPPIPVEPGVADQTVTFSTTTQSAKFAGRMVTIIGSAAFHYVVGENPTATTSHLKVPADTLLTLSVQPGHKIAAVAAS